MTIYEPNPDVRPTGEEAAEFVEPPQDERGPADPGSDEDHGNSDDRPADWRLYTGERLETEAGPYRPQQMNVGRDNVAGGGEWPDPETEPHEPAPGAS
jgi:hypothetical protein